MSRTKQKSGCKKVIGYRRKKGKIVKFKGMNKKSCLKKNRKK